MQLSQVLSFKKHSKPGTFMLFHSASHVNKPDCVQLNRIDSQSYSCSFNYSTLMYFKRVWLACIFSNNREQQHNPSTTPNTALKCLF